MKNPKIKDEKYILGISKEKFKLIHLEENILDEKFETESIGLFKDVLIRFSQNRASVISFIIIGLIIFFALVGPSMNKYGFNDQDVNRVNLPPKIAGLDKLGIVDGSKILKNRRKEFLDDIDKYPEGSILEVVNEYTIQNVEMVDIRVDQYKIAGAGEDNFWFGTDYLGRDLWTRLWRGTRISLTIALLSVVVNLFIGVIYGAIAGYYGGKIDMYMMRVTEILRAFPQIVVLTLFIMYFGTGMFSIVMSLVIKGWIETARMVRAQFYRFKGSEYVLAARTLGVRDSILIFRHILPNSIGPIITQTVIAVPSAIFAESFLAFIGLGLQAPEPSIGVLLSHGQKVLLQYPHQTLFPGLIISLLMISFNLLGNGLRDAFDPTLRGS